MTDERDPKVSQRYRQLPGDEPSRELDQSILAAAYRSVDRPHAPLVVPAGRHRWYYGLGAAAVLVLAIAVTMNVERQRPDTELTEAPPAAAPPPRPQYAKPASEPAEQPRRDTTARQERRPAYTPEPPPSTPAAPAPTESAPPSAGAMADAAGARSDAEALAREEQAKENVQALKKERAATESAPAPAAAASRVTPVPTAAQYAALPPERELERIAELRRQGRGDEADKALAEFRKRYPNYVISDEMKAKVERK